VAHAGNQGKRTHGNIPHAYATFRTPRPWTFSFEAGLLARGSSHPSHLPKTRWFQWLRADARRSQLRGQLRHCSACHRHHAPYSRLSFRRESEEPRTLDIVDDMKFPSTTMMFEFRKVWGLFGADINGRSGPTLAPSIATSKWGRLPNCRLVPLVRQRRCLEDCRVQSQTASLAGMPSLTMTCRRRSTGHLA